MSKRLLQDYRRWLHSRIRSAQMQRPGCCLVHRLGIDEDGLISLSFLCLNHEGTTWTEKYNYGTRITPTNSYPPRNASICTMERESYPPGLEALEIEEEACEDEASESVGEHGGPG